MLFDNLTNRKQNDKKKLLKYFINIFNRKLRLDSRIKQNKSESKKILKNIEEIDNKSENIFKHYSKVEKELIHYIAELKVKNDLKEGNLNPKIKEINENNLKLLETLQKKRIKIIEEKRKELEQILDNYQIQLALKRDNLIYDQIEKDYLVFQKLEEEKQELEKLSPKLIFLEKEIDKIKMINKELRAKYEIIKIENKCLLSLVERLNKKNSKIVNNNSIIINNNMNKSQIINNRKSKIQLKDKIIINNNLNTSRRRNNNNLSNYTKKSFSNSTKIPSSSIKLKYKKNNIFFGKKNNIFISQNNIYNHIFINKSNINRCSSAKIINRNREKEINFDKNKYIIKLLKELNVNIEKKYNEKYNLYSKELEIQNKMRNMIHLCVEDLNSIYKIEKNKNKKEINSDNNNKDNDESKVKDVEQKLFIFSYIYDNCLKNGEIKELKRHYSMFQQKK